MGFGQDVMALENENLFLSLPWTRTAVTTRGAHIEQDSSVLGVWCLAREVFTSEGGGAVGLVVGCAHVHAVGYDQ